jgi:hypothetical protein
MWLVERKAKQFVTVADVLTADQVAQVVAIGDTLPQAPGKVVRGTGMIDSIRRSRVGFLDPLHHKWVYSRVADVVTMPKMPVITIGTRIESQRASAASCP